MGVEKKGSVVIAGGGVAGLICAARLVKSGVRVSVFDRMEKPGRKLLLAGISGLNLTNTEDPETFSSRYRQNEKIFRKLLADHPPEEFVSFLEELGIETFTGSSGKIFPLGMSSDIILEKIMEYLYSTGIFSFTGGCRLTGFEAGRIFFMTEKGEKTVDADTVVFALGGGSRANTGSDGRWVEIFNDAGINTFPLEPSNCGFETAWSEQFRKDIGTGIPLKNISVSCGKDFSRAEILLTEYGIEGSGIYFLGSGIREQLKRSGTASVCLDILPDLTEHQIIEKLEKSRGKNTVSNYLRKRLSINALKFRLVREVLAEDKFRIILENPGMLKKLTLEIKGTRPLDEAISSAGGVCMDELDINMMLKKMPGFYVVGEMAGWDAPTGGYLIQGCYSTASAAAESIIHNLNNHRKG